MTEKIRITEDDLRGVNMPEAPRVAPITTAPGEAREWGTISGASAPSGTEGVAEERGSFWLKSWVYLSLAGGFGALLAWAITEPGFTDLGEATWGNLLCIPLMIAFMCVAFGVSESVVERSTAKAITRGLLALPTGLILGFVFYVIGNFVYRLGGGMAASSGAELGADVPLLWLIRSVAWTFFGMAGGLAYGLIGQSWKKCLFGMLGGMLGAALGGALFDPISLLTSGGAASRCVGAVIFAAMTGGAIGLVESALKNRWLYVAGGPLAGKQFILYKKSTQLGGEQTNDIYLFKDLSISPVHATIELRGAVAILHAMGPTYVGGQPVAQKVLRSGDLIQIGRYYFHYQEKQIKS